MKSLFTAIACGILTCFIAACGSGEKPGEDANAEQPKPTGESIYNRTCVACHQATGEGLPKVFPPLAQSDYLANKEKTILQVIKGSSGELMVNGQKYNNVMPPQPLNDEEVAAVLTYVYCNFGNTGGTVTPEECKALREKK